MGRTTSGGGRQARLTLSFSRGRWESFSSAMSLLEPERETAVKAGRRRLFFSPTPKDGRLGLPAGHTTGFPAGMHENVFGLDGDVLLRPFVHGEVVLPQHHLVCAGSPGKEIPPPGFQRLSEECAPTGSGSPSDRRGLLWKKEPKQGQEL